MTQLLSSSTVKVGLAICRVDPDEYYNQIGVITQIVYYLGQVDAFTVRFVYSGIVETFIYPERWEIVDDSKLDLIQRYNHAILYL